MGGGSPSNILVYILLFLYYYILTYKFIIPIHYFFQCLMKYHIKWYNGYWLPFLILEHVSVVDTFTSKGYHQQYYPFSNLYPWIRGWRYWGQVIPLPCFIFGSYQKRNDYVWSNITFLLTNRSQVIFSSTEVRKNISFHINEPSTPITKAAPVMMYYSCFYPTCNWDHYSNTLIDFKRKDVMRAKLIFIDLSHSFKISQRENFKPLRPVRGFI